MVAVSFAFSKEHKAYWNCKCDCGTEKVLEARRITDKKYKSCGLCRPKKKEKSKKVPVVKDDLYWITKWVKRNLLRKSSEIFKSRRKLKIEEVVRIAIEGKKRYPYMSFTGGTNKGLNASLDRVDSSKDYSDIANLRVIPLWLNSAKLQMSDEELNNLMKHHLGDLYGNNL